MSLLDISGEGTKEGERSEKILVWSTRLTEKMIKDGVVDPEDKPCFIKRN